MPGTKNEATVEFSPSGHPYGTLCRYRCNSTVCLHFRHVNLQLEPGQPHPAAVIATQESWPVLQRTCSTYTADSR